MKTSTILAGVAAAALAAPSLAQQMDAATAAKAFGAREMIQQISLSPDGTKVAIIAPNGTKGTQVMIADPLKGGDATVALRTDGSPQRVTSCGWVTDARLICEVYFVSSDLDLKLGVTRLVALNVDGGGGKMLTADTTSRALDFTQNGGVVVDWQADGKGSVLMTRDRVPENTIGTRLASDAEGLGVERVNTMTLQRSWIEPAREYATDYISDGQGTVRIMGLMAPAPGGQISDQIAWSYRKQGERGWQILGSTTRANDRWNGFYPSAVDPGTNVAFGFDQLDGRQALFRVALDGTGKRELVLARPDVDVDSLVTIGRQRRVVGVSYATEARRVEFFDPELVRLRQSLGRALKQGVSFVDASADEKVLLIFAGSDVDPGRYHLYNKTSHELTEVLPSRPLLAGMKLGEMRPVTYIGPDGTNIPAYLTLPPGSDGKNLPAIVMPHGGPSSRDEWGFDWLAQFYAARGYAVLQPNYRGSAGFGEGWLGKNGFQSWRLAIDDVNAAGRWLQAQGIAAPGKLAIVGWSYGGYAALQTSVVDPDLFKAIVAIAPVTDFGMVRDETSRYVNHATTARLVGSGPHLREGSPLQNAAAIKGPVLLFHGDHDLNVRVDQSRAMAKRLREAGRQVDYVEFKDLDHQLDDSAVRTQMLAKSDAFLRTALGMAP